MTFYVKRPGQREGQSVSPVGERSWESLDAALDEWCLFLPHQCDAWEIAVGGHAEVLSAAKAFRAELDRAIAVLEEGGEQS